MIVLNDPMPAMNATCVAGYSLSKRMIESLNDHMENPMKVMIIAVIKDGLLKRDMRFEYRDLGEV